MSIQKFQTGGEVFTEKEKLVFILSVMGWFNLLFIAFVNIATPRYLMPVLPLLILATVIFVIDILSQLRVGIRDKSY